MNFNDIINTLDESVAYIVVPKNTEGIQSSAVQKVIIQDKEYGLSDMTGDLKTSAQTFLGSGKGDIKVNGYLTAGGNKIIAAMYNKNTGKFGSVVDDSYLKKEPKMKEIVAMADGAVPSTT